MGRPAVSPPADCTRCRRPGRLSSRQPIHPDPESPTHLSRRNLMNAKIARPLALALGLAMLLGASSCAKKSTKTAPTPPPTPPVEKPAPPPPPPPPPTPPTPPPAPPPSPPKVTAEDFKPAFFDFDAYKLREDARQALDQDAKLLRDNPSVQVTIE